MRYLVAIGLAVAVLAAAGCSNGMGKGHQTQTVMPPPPPPPPPPPNIQSNGMGKGVQSNGMGKGIDSNGMGKGVVVGAAAPPPPPPAAQSNGKAMHVVCRITAIHRAQRSFVCRMHRESLEFYATGASELRNRGKAVPFRTLRVGQSVRIRYFRDRTRMIDRVTILH